MGELSGKKIFLAAPRYYGYETFIQKELENLGAKVLFKENKAFHYDPANKGTPWYLKWLCKKNAYINRQLLPATKQHFDICLFINLFSFHPALIEELRRHNPQIRCVLYLWDNLRGYKWEQYFKYFDAVYTFDPVEASALNLKHLPNFFIEPRPETVASPLHFDVCCIGSFQIHRLKILEKEAEKMRPGKRKFFFYLYMPPSQKRLKYNPLAYQATGLFPGRFKGYKKLYNLMFRKTEHELIKHHPLPLPDAMRYMAQSRCIIDLPYPAQTGSTHRIISALALNKKIITTNKSILQEPFYRSGCIRLVSMADFHIDWDWVDQEISSPVDMKQLRLDNWLTCILS